jgi:hypothetical protein
MVRRTGADGGGGVDMVIMVVVFGEGGGADFGVAVGIVCEKDKRRKFFQEDKTLRVHFFFLKNFQV